MGNYCNNSLVVFLFLFYLLRVEQTPVGYKKCRHKNNNEISITTTPSINRKTSKRVQMGKCATHDKTKFINLSLPWGEHIN